MANFQTPEPISIDIQVGVAVLHVAVEARDTTIVEVRPSDPANKSDMTAAQPTPSDVAKRERKPLRRSRANRQ